MLRPAGSGVGVASVGDFGPWGRWRALPDQPGCRENGRPGFPPALRGLDSLRLGAHAVSSGRWRGLLRVSVPSAARW